MILQRFKQYNNKLKDIASYIQITIFYNISDQLIDTYISKNQIKYLHCKVNKSDKVMLMIEHLNRYNLISKSLAYIIIFLLENYQLKLVN